MLAERIVEKMTHKAYLEREDVGLGSALSQLMNALNVDIVEDYNYDSEIKEKPGLMTNQ